MKRRVWGLFVAAFAGLIGLMVVAGMVLYRYASAVQVQIDRTQEDYVKRNEVLEALRADVASLAIELRDYVLNPARSTDAEHRRRLFEVRDAVLSGLNETGRLMGSEDPVRVRHLRRSFDGYWGSVETVLRWTPSETRAKGPAFLQQSGRPSRNALLTTMGEIRVLNATTLQRRQANVRRGLATIRVWLVLVLGVAVLLSFIIALFTAVKMRFLEQSAERQHRQTKEAAGELRRLSQRLVKAQEDERSALSRELHDEIGQMLTALRMELGNLGQSASSADQGGSPHLQAANALAEQLLQGVRDMARGLRPAMLDELGLASALTSYAREFSRRSGIPVSLQVEGSVEHLPDNQRTCVYRVAQEALTNCARHARAKKVLVTLRVGEEGLTLTVQDDGVGFDRHKLRGKGLGLLGIEERVGELGGTFTVSSQARQGALLRVELPFTPELSA